MKIETQAEADALNESGEYGPYRALNGHTMIAPVEFPRVYPGDPGYREENTIRYQSRDYKIGDDVRYQSFAAWCADDCAACGEGDPLPDW